MPDFRQFYSVGLFETEPRERLLLIMGLADETRSRYCAEKHPEMKSRFSSEWAILADIFDLHVQINTPKGKKPKPYPRPWDTSGGTQIGGKKRKPLRTSLANAKALFNRFGHNFE